MGFRKLQLNLLSDSGQLLNCINCFAGQVSVLRASSYNALQVYQRALAGIPGPERVSVILDGQAFSPSAHLFIGFGEHLMSSGERVLDAFTELGFTEETTVPFVRSYGVELTPQTVWSSLTKCEERRVRLLLATQQPNRVLVLNDPFEPLAQQWRERLAELLANYARTKNHIVIVTSLSFRPESWIDNPVISRIQVGEEIQRTIGYGTAPSQAHQVLTQVRDMLKDDAEVQRAVGGSSGAHRVPSSLHAKVESTATAEPQYQEEETDDSRAVMFAPAFAAIGLLVPSLRGLPSAQRAAITRAFLARPVVSAGLAIGIIIGGISSLTLMGGNDEVEVSIVAAPPVEPIPDTEPVQVSMNVQPPAPVVDVKPAAAVNNPVQETPPENSPFVLDEYTAAVKRSVINSYQREVSPSAPQAAPINEESVGAVGTKSRETGELLELLESASGSGDNLPDSPVNAGRFEPPVDNYQFRGPPAAAEYQNEEEKREAIRKKFLEAIERAQEMRRNQPPQ